MDELQKKANDALTALKEAKNKPEISPEEKKVLEKNLTEAQTAWEKGLVILEDQGKTDPSKKAEFEKWKPIFEESKKQYEAELTTNKDEKAEKTDAEKEKTQTETNNLATEIAPKLGRYSIEELKTLTNKAWNQLWKDAKYVLTIQHIIIETGAKYPPIKDSILANKIYGSGTIAGIKTLQTYLNTKYKTKLETDGWAGSTTLKALLVMDGDKTRLEKIIADHADIKPLAPEKKSSTTPWTGSVSITNPPQTGAKEGKVDGHTDDKEITLKNNTPKWIKSIDELPKDKDGNFKRDKKLNISYLFKKDWIRYRFFDTGSVAVLNESTKKSEMQNSKNIINKLQNSTDNNIIDNIDTFTNTIKKEYPKYLNELFKVMNKSQQEYYKTHIWMKAVITCTSDNPDIILHINKAEVKLQKSDYLKSDGKTINYSTINQKVFSYIDEKIKENQQKEHANNIQSLKEKLDNLNGYTIDVLFPNTKDKKIKDFFALFGKSGIKFDNIYSVTGDKNKVQFVFDISWRNSYLINGEMIWKININDILKGNKIDENLFKEQLRKNITNNLNNAKRPEESPNYYAK